MNTLMKLYLPHLIGLNFGNEQLSRVTDPANPRLALGTPLVAFDFSANPKYIYIKICLKMTTTMVKPLV